MQVPFWRSPMTGNVLAVVAFLIVTVDAPIARMVQDMDPWLSDLFGTLTQAGDSKWYLIPAGLAFLASAGVRGLLTRPRGKQISAWCAAASGYLFAAVAVSGLLVDAIKVLFGRARPSLLAVEGAAGFHPLVLDPQLHSFPSGHANTFMVVGLVAASLVPRYRRWILALAAAMTLTRVAVNAHFLSDVVAGGAIGVLTTSWLCAWFTARGWVFELDRGGRRRLRAPGRWMRAAGTGALRHAAGALARRVRSPRRLGGAAGP